MYRFIEKRPRTIFLKYLEAQNHKVKQLSVTMYVMPQQQQIQNLLTLKRKTDIELPLINCQISIKESWSQKCSSC